jgi:hypothetical protein
MIKLARLLSESTIIDFSMIGRLCLRYRGLLSIAVIVFFTVTVYLFETRPVIYTSTIPAKMIFKQDHSKDLVVNHFLNEQKVISVDELKISLYSQSFMKAFAVNLIKNPKFRIEGILFNNKKLVLSDYYQCRHSENCKIETLSSKLSDTFQIEPNVTDDRFTITVMVVEKWILPIVSKALLESIEKEDVKNKALAFSKELNSIENLIGESKSVIKSKGGNDTLEEQTYLLNTINEYYERIKTLQQNLSMEAVLESSLAAKLKENKKTFKKDETFQKPEVVATRLKIQELKSNILFLTESESTEVDRKILNQLKKELSDIQKNHPSEFQLHTIEQKESFKEKQREGMDNLNFEYEVSKNKKAKLLSELESTKAILNQSLEKKLQLDQSAGVIKTDMEFLKNLESKQMSLKLAISTVTSDMFFEDSSLVGQEYRTSSSLFILSFGSMVSLLIYLLSIMFRFMMDDRIYNSDDVEHEFKGLCFVGTVPSFSDK